MSKPTFRPIAPLDVDDQALDAINDRLGVPKMVRTGVTTTITPAAPKPAPSALSPHEKLTVELPVYLMDAMKLDSAKQRVSVRHIVMRALQNAGYTIEDRDMVPDARRSSSKARA